MSSASPSAGLQSGRIAPISLSLMAAMVILTCGHVLSNLLRTAPAVALDLMAADLKSTTQTIAGLTSAYHFFFALFQLPVGVALDRYSIRSVAMVLFAGTIAGAALAATASGPVSFFLAQSLIGMATSGMLMCPIALAGKKLSPAQFGVWSGIILSIGNGGMLLSASPLAFVVEHWGWRAGFWIAAAAAIVVAALIMLIVPADRPAATRQRALFTEMANVARLGVSPVLRGIAILAFVTLAVQISLRGLWAGPWLMDIKGLSRLEAGNVLALFTVALVVGPATSGLLDRRIGNRRGLLLVGQCLAALLISVIALGAPGYPLARMLGLPMLPVSADMALLVGTGFLVSMQPLIYAMTRQVVDVANVGKAMSAVNLAFFLGTAVLQSITSPIAAAWGLPAVLFTMSVFLAGGAIIFFILTRPGPAITKA